MTLVAFGALALKVLLAFLAWAGAGLFLYAGIDMAGHREDPVDVFGAIMFVVIGLLLLLAGFAVFFVT